MLNRLDVGERKQVLERAAHVREVLTAFRSGSEELPAVGELTKRNRTSPPGREASTGAKAVPGRP